MEIIIGTASNSISQVVIAPVFQLMMDVIHKNDNSQVLQADLTRMKNLLADLTTLFQHQQREPPESIKNLLEILQNSLTEAALLLDRSEPRQRCLECLTCTPVRLSRQIKEWNHRFDKLYQDLERGFSLMASAGQIVSLASQQGETLLQDVPTSGFEGSGIKDAQTQVETWLKEDDKVRLVGVYGMAGIGKTSLLKMVYNYFKVSNVFRHVIWVTVSQKYEILSLQGDIAKEINLNFPSNSSIDMHKMKLSKYMKDQKFLLVLDDLWNRLHLHELGVAFGDGKDSKVIFSTRNKVLIDEMQANKSIEIQLLTKDEAWMLFERIAFKEDHVPSQIEVSAKKIAEECKGLPLAINVVAAAMNNKTSVDEWEQSLSLMKCSDPSFPLTHPTVDQELYQRLRWSYDALRDSNIKNCFLYCAMFPEDAVIDADELVRMWISERLVKSKHGTHLMDMAIGREYVKLLEDRCLFQNVKNKIKKVGTDHCIKVHDVIRDMAIHIGEKEQNFFIVAGQNLQNFPHIQDEDSKMRISLVSNCVDYLPIEFRCLKLVSLMLGSNPIQAVPSGFVVNLISLKVLDLSNTRMYSIPAYLGQLRMLEFLTLSRLPISKLPDEICLLCRLQFLNLSYCGQLESLPYKIGQLKNLSYLNLSGCLNLVMIPPGISKLTKLSMLYLWLIPGLRVRALSPASSIWCLKGLKNLTQLAIKIITKPGRESRIREGIMETWSEMKHLWLSFNPLLHTLIKELPEDMQEMKKLQSLYMRYYHGLSLPSSICNFEHLEKVTLYHCQQLTELSTLESLPNLRLLKLSFLSQLKELGVGISSRPSGFQVLEKLVLQDLPLLKSMAESSHNEVWNEQTLPKLHVLKIYNCPSLRRFPTGMEKLLRLNVIVGNINWWETLFWENDDIKLCMERLFKER